MKMRGCWIHEAGVVLKLKRKIDPCFGRFDSAAVFLIPVAWVLTT
jgi:hypothetical protein